MDQSALDYERRHRDGIAATERHCGALENAPHGEAAAYLRQAALAGVPEAMVRYADGQLFDGVGFAFIRDPEFATWRREAPRMVERAIHLGEPAAVFQSYAARTNDGSLLGGLIPDDPQAAARYRILMGLLNGWPPGAFHGLSADEVHLAELEARQLHREFFHSRVLAPGLMNAHLMPLTSDAGDLSSRTLCE